MRGNPDVLGAAASAWRVVKKPAPTDPPDWAGCLVQWQINSTRFHPFWAWWLLQVIHLRDIPGVRPAVKSHPEAQHELMIIALDPQTPMIDPDEKPSATRGYRFLTPIELAHQFHGLDDAGAERLAELSVRAICDGFISPDSDYRSRWRKMISATVEHMVIGSHPSSAS